MGYLYKNTSKTLLIFCHGVDSINSYPGQGVEDVFDFYYQTGTSVFSFDFTGYGESEGKKKISIKQRVSDIGSIVNYFSQKYKKIILYGQKDKEVKPIQSIDFFIELCARKKLLSVPGGDHTLMDKEKWKYLGPVLKWIREDVVY